MTDALILAIETTTRSCSVSLCKNGAPWIVRSIEGNTGQAEQLTMMIQAVFEQANKTLPMLDAIAISQGPGSYTGLRIGVSTAKGLCFALDKPMVAVDTLKALAVAEAATESTTKSAKTAYVALMDARRMDAYAGIYRADGTVIQAPFFCTLTEESFVEVLEREGIERLVVVGDAAEKYQPVITHAAIEVGSTAPPSARHLAALAQAHWTAGETVDVAYFEPFYLKKPNITKPKPKF